MDAIMQLILTELTLHPSVLICKLIPANWFMDESKDHYFRGLGFLTPWLDLVDLVDL
jgi:hypothetical protein